GLVRQLPDLPLAERPTGRELLLELSQLALILLPPRLTEDWMLIRILLIDVLERLGEPCRPRPRDAVLSLVRDHGSLRRSIATIPFGSPSLWVWKNSRYSIPDGVACAFARESSPPNFDFCAARPRSNVGSTRSSLVGSTPATSQRESKSPGAVMAVTK